MQVAHRGHGVLFRLPGYYQWQRSQRLVGMAGWFGGRIPLDPEGLEEFRSRPPVQGVWNEMIVIFWRFTVFYNQIRLPSTSFVTATNLT